MHDHIEEDDVADHYSNESMAYAGKGQIFPGMPLFGL